MVASNICGSAEWNLLHVTLLASRILRWVVDFWKICGPLSFFFIFVAQQPLVGPGLFISEASRSHSRHTTVGRTPLDEWSAQRTWQHTTFTRDRHLSPRWDSNPRSQQASGRTPTLLTARPLVSAIPVLLIMSWTFRGTYLKVIGIYLPIHRIGLFPGGKGGRCVGLKTRTTLTL